MTKLFATLDCGMTTSLLPRSLKSLDTDSTREHIFVSYQPSHHHHSHLHLTYSPDLNPKSNANKLDPDPKSHPQQAAEKLKAKEDARAAYAAESTKTSAPTNAKKKPASVFEALESNSDSD